MAILKAFPTFNIKESTGLLEINPTKKEFVTRLKSVDVYRTVLSS